MLDQWIRAGDGFLLIYSITSINSFQKCINLRDKILRTKDDDTKKCPIVLVGNKCDLQTERQVQTSEAKRLANEWGAKFFETSAKTKVNNIEIFHECVRYISIYYIIVYYFILKQYNILFLYREIQGINSKPKLDDKKDKKKRKPCIIL